MYTFLFIGCPLEGKRLFRLATFKGGIFVRDWMKHCNRRDGRVLCNNARCCFLDFFFIFLFLVFRLLCVGGDGGSAQEA